MLIFHLSTDNAGQLLLAKTRYNQGSNSISTAQIPTENSEDFKALCNVEKEQDIENTIAGEKKHLIRHKVEKSQGYVEPLHWFAALPPTTLRNATEYFKKSVELVVQGANIQTELLAVMDKIERLKQIKKQLVL